MIKKIISIAMILVMLCGTAGTVYANDSDTLVNTPLWPHAFTSDDKVWREYTADGATEVSMQEDEYCIVNPLHRVDTNYLSYQAISVESSDRKVVTGSIYNPAKGKYEDGISKTAPAAREYLGVRLHAKGEGTATVTVKYATFLTKLGLRYTDERGTPYFTKVIYVDVTEKPKPLEVSLNISSNVYPSVGSLRFYMSKIKDVVDPLSLLSGRDLYGEYDLKGSLDMSDFSDTASGPGIDLKGSVDMSDLRDTALDITGTLAESAARNARIDGEAYKAATGSDWAAMGRKANNMGFLSGLAKTVSGVIGVVSKVKQAFYDIPKALGQGLKEVPVFDHRNLKLEIRLKNISDKPVNNVRVDVLCNQFLSLYASRSGWGKDLYCKNPIVSIAPGETVVKKLFFYPRLAFSKTYDISASALAYTGVFDVKCRYVDGMGTAVDQKESIELPVYSLLTREQLQTLLKDMMDNPNYYNNMFGASDFQHMLYVECPVEVLILDAQGSELAVIGTDDTEGYQDEGITAGANGEEKFVVISPEKLADYQVKIRAAEDGTMDVFSSDFSGNTGISVNMYDAVPLRKGDVFDVAFSEDAAGKICAAGENGSLDEIEPSTVINRDTVEQAMKECGLSDWAVENISGAIIHGLVLETELESPQDRITREMFCELILHYYELYSDEEIAEQLTDFLDELPEGTSAVSMAAAAGLISEEYADKMLEDAEAPITRGEAAEIILNCLKLLELDVLPAGEEIADSCIENLFEIRDAEEEIAIDGEGAEAAESEAAEDTLPETESETELPKEDAAADADETPLLTQEQAVDAVLAMGIMDSEGSAVTPGDRLTYEQAVSALYELWEYSQMIFVRNQFIREKSDEVLDSLQQCYRKDYMEGVQYWIPKENMADTVLRNFSVYFPGLDETVTVKTDLTDWLQEIIIPYVNGFAKGYVKRITDKNGPLDWKRLTGETDSVLDNLKCFECGEGYLAGDDESFYHWTPVYFEDADGGIYEDMVYLFVSIGTEGIDEEFAAENDLVLSGNMRWHYLLIADQNVVSDYLKTIQPVIDCYRPTAEPEQYEELSVGSSGSEVEALQKELIAKGYLQGTADGAYGNMTGEAVAAFQQSAGLEATGIADASTQNALFGQTGGDTELLTDWIDRHAG